MALLDIGIIAVGLRLLRDPIFCGGKFDYCTDLSGYNVPLGIVVIMYGAYALTADMLPNHKESLLLCPKCESTFRHSQTPDGKCPSCKVDVEPLEGFYKRHPEKKGEKQKL
ncbi:hypothetical protein JCM12178A_03690 [Salidesulfovibrio brasiliensis]